MTYAFSFDARYCSGCKACQAACKDKNNLPTGVLLRRVYEVSGGAWQQAGDAWTSTVFAYNLSVACNHCIHPKCAGVCPTKAYTVRANGIVYLDTDKCVGCGYCAWACPYGAPQYNAQAGHMVKCDFCYDNLEQGSPPACVAACPLRVLNYGSIEGMLGSMALWETPPDSHPFPLPSFSHTQPRLAITPHAAMKNEEQKFVANEEEIQPRKPSMWEDLPLILFTLLTQLAVGTFWVMSILSLSLQTSEIWLLPLLFIGGSLCMGMLASFAHLGNKKNAWRVLSNVRKSSLSREILFTGLFGLGWLITTVDTMFWHANIFLWPAITTVLGLGLLHNMSQVYRFRAAPGWNSWRTNVGFLVSTSLLGLAAMVPFLIEQANTQGTPLPAATRIGMTSAILMLLLTQVLLTPRSFHRRLRIARLGLIVAGICLNLAITLPLNAQNMEIATGLFILVAAEETMGRWIFYRSRLGSTQLAAFRHTSP